MNKILITGGAGFIGSNLAKSFPKDTDIFIVDDLSMGKKENIKDLKNVIFFEESILNYEFINNLLKTENFDYIFHLAAIASVADSIDRPLETSQVNFNATLNILNTLKKINNLSLKRFVFASSAAVYGNLADLPKKESSCVNPTTPYAIDKYASEKYTLSFNQLYGIPTSSVRFFNVYGPNQNPKSPYSGVISIIIDKFTDKLNGMDTKFSLYGDGKQTRDFIYVDDVIQALKLVAYSKEALGNVYNVGTGKETSLNELIKMISMIFNLEINISNYSERDGDIKESFADIELLENLGFKQRYTIQQGLEKYIETSIINERTTDM